MSSVELIINSKLSFWQADLTHPINISLPENERYNMDVDLIVSDNFDYDSEISLDLELTFYEAKENNKKIRKQVIPMGDFKKDEIKELLTKFASSL